MNVSKASSTCSSRRPLTLTVKLFPTGFSLVTNSKHHYPCHLLRPRSSNVFLEVCILLSFLASSSCCMRCLVALGGVLFQATAWKMCCGALRTFRSRPVGFISTVFSSFDFLAHVPLSDTKPTFVHSTLFTKKKNVLQTWCAKNISNVSQAFCSASDSRSSSSR